MHDELEPWMNGRLILIDFWSWLNLVGHLISWEDTFLSFKKHFMSFYHCCFYSF